MQSPHTCKLKNPDLPEEATKSHIIKELSSGSLLSIEQLCDLGCTAHFTKEKLNIFVKRKLIMQGTRQLNTLWIIDTPTISTDSVNSVIDVPTMSDRIIFTMHASLRQQ